MGLAVASDIGIAMQTLTIAVLLHQRHMVSLASLDYAELGRCVLAAIASGTAVWVVFSWLGGIAKQVWIAQYGGGAQSRLGDLAILLVGTALWLAVTDWVLTKTGSALPQGGTAAARTSLSRLDAQRNPQARQLVKQNPSQGTKAPAPARALALERTTGLL